jgi:hypothetical protein
VAELVAKAVAGKGKEPMGSQKRRRDLEDRGAFLSGGSMQRVFDLVMKNVEGSGGGAGSSCAAGSARPSSAVASALALAAAAGAGASDPPVSKIDGDESCKRAKVQIVMQALKRTDANNAMDNLSNGLASFGGAGHAAGLGTHLTEDDQDADLQAALAASAAMNQ